MRSEYERRSKYVQVEDSVPARCQSVIGAIQYGRSGDRKYVEEIELFNPPQKLENESFSLSHPSFVHFLISGGHCGGRFCAVSIIFINLLYLLSSVYDEQEFTYQAQQS
jgi:hypothetical protein